MVSKIVNNIFDPLSSLYPPNVGRIGRGGGIIFQFYIQITTKLWHIQQNLLSETDYVMSGHSSGVTIYPITPCHVVHAVATNAL